MTGESFVPLTPLISIITPTKNRLLLLQQTMDSVAAQSFIGWEHIIVDDGSDDGTAEEVQRRAAADSRVRWIVRGGEASGASVCRNIGWRDARADLVIFLDSDDLLDPDSLALRNAAMSRNQDLDFCVFRTGVFEKARGDLGRELDPEMLGDDLLRFLLFETPWQTTAPTWRRAALERLGGFDLELPSWQDVDLHIRAIASGMRYLRFARVDHHMRWQWEDNKVSVLQRRSPQHLRNAPSIVEKFERIVREGPGMTWSRQRAICGLYFHIAMWWIEAGSLQAGLMAWRAVWTRQLAGRRLYLAGNVLLRLRAMAGSRKFVDRIINKWRGMVRMRTNPDLVPR